MSPMKTYKGHYFHLNFTAVTLFCSDTFITMSCNSSSIALFTAKIYQILCICTCSINVVATITMILYFGLWCGNKWTLNLILFHSELYGTVATTASKVKTHINCWLPGEVSVGLILEIDPSCLLCISSFSDPKCQFATSPLPGTSSYHHSKCHYCTTYPLLKAGWLYTIRPLTQFECSWSYCPSWSF